MNYFSLEYQTAGVVLIFLIVRLLWHAGDLIKAKADVIAFNTTLAQKRNRMGPFAPKPDNDPVPMKSASKSRDDEDDD